MIARIAWVVATALGVLIGVDCLIDHHSRIGAVVIGVAMGLISGRISNLEERAK